MLTVFSSDLFGHLLAHVFLNQLITIRLIEVPKAGLILVSSPGLQPKEVL